MKKTNKKKNIVRITRMFRKRLPEITYYQKLELEYETFYTEFNIHDFKKVKKEIFKY
jgi:hypothetical protein